MSSSNNKYKWFHIFDPYVQNLLARLMALLTSSRHLFASKLVSDEAQSRDKLKLKIFDLDINSIRKSQISEYLI